MNKFLLIALCSSQMCLNAMEFDIPAVKDAQEKDEVTKDYFQRLEVQYRKHFNYDLQISYAIENPQDEKSAVIKRFTETVIGRAFLIRSPHLEQHFKKLHKNSQAQNNRWGLLGRKLHQSLRIGKECEEALRSTLADRRLITYILRGTYDQPWIIRPEFDQEWSKIRNDIKEQMADRNAVSEKAQRIERALLIP